MFFPTRRMADCQKWSNCIAKRSLSFPLTSKLFNGSAVSDSWRPRALRPMHSPMHLSFLISWNLLRLMSVTSVMPSKHLIFCCSLLPPSVFPRIRVFSNMSALHIKQTKYWSFNFSISPSNVYSRLISFRIDYQAQK